MSMRSAGWAVGERDIRDGEVGMVGVFGDESWISGCNSSANGLVIEVASLEPVVSAFRFRRPNSELSNSAAVVNTGVFSLSRVPSLSTKWSKLFDFVTSSCFSFRFSSMARARSKISCLAFRRRSTASGLSSSRADASGVEFREGDGGVISSPRLCKAMAIFLLEESTH